MTRCSLLIGLLLATTVSAFHAPSDVGMIKFRISRPSDSVQKYKMRMRLAQIHLDAGQPLEAELELRGMYNNSEAMGVLGHKLVARLGEALFMQPVLPPPSYTH